MSTSPSLHPELQEYQRQHEEIRDRVIQLANELTPEQFHYSPGPGRWTIAQNLEHLSLECEEQSEIIYWMLARGHTDQIYGEGPFQHSAWGDWYIRFTEPPYKVKIPTIARYVPPAELAADEVTVRFLGAKRRVLNLIEAADGLDLGRLRAPLPYLSAWNPSLSLGQWFPYIAAHERRHLWQIENIRRSPGYPEGSSPMSLLMSA